MKYKDEITKAMTWLAEQPNTIFVGQAVEYPGTFMHATLEGVPEHKRMEFPVCESFQMQFCMGLARAGYIPICIFPRQNFMLHAIGDIVNTLDKLDVGKVIIRVASGTTKPIFPGIQHVGHFPSCILAASNIEKMSLKKPEAITDAYFYAYESDRSIIMIEHGDLYGT